MQQGSPIDEAVPGATSHCPPSDDMASGLGQANARRAECKQMRAAGPCLWASGPA